MSSCYRIILILILIRCKYVFDWFRFSEIRLLLVASFYKEQRTKAKKTESSTSHVKWAKSRKKKHRLLVEKPNRWRYSVSQNKNGTLCYHGRLIGGKVFVSFPCICNVAAHNAQTRSVSKAVLKNKQSKRNKNQKQRRE